jgi:hypothetical protein
MEFWHGLMAYLPQGSSPEAMVPNPLTVGDSEREDSSTGFLVAAGGRRERDAYDSWRGYNIGTRHQHLFKAMGVP